MQISAAICGEWYYLLFGIIPLFFFALAYYINPELLKSKIINTLAFFSLLLFFTILFVLPSGLLIYSYDINQFWLVFNNISDIRSNLVYLVFIYIVAKFFFIIECGCEFNKTLQ